MSFAFMPIYTGDYLRDTRHLTPMRHGIYLLALMHCWDQKGPMPLDEQECAGVCNCRSADEIEALRYIISRFFVRMEDGHYNQRMQREVERSEAISGARSVAGKAGAIARAKQLLNKSQARAKQEPLPPPPPPPLSPTSQTNKEVSAAAAKRPAPPPPPFCGESNADQIPPRAVVALSAAWELPQAWGTDAERLGWPGSRIVKEAEKFRQYWTAGKGSGKRRTLKGWRQSWSTWLAKAGEYA